MPYCLQRIERTTSNGERRLTVSWSALTIAWVYREALRQRRRSYRTSLCKRRAGDLVEAIVAHRVCVNEVHSIQDGISALDKESWLRVAEEWLKLACQPRDDGSKAAGTGLWLNLNLVDYRT